MRSCAHGAHPCGAGKKIILESDGECAMQSLKTAVGKYFGGIIIPEVSASGESQSNGAAEQEAQVVAEFVRVLKEQIEHKVGIKLKPTDTLSQWVIRRAAIFCSKYMVGDRRKNNIRTEKRETMPNASCPTW